MQSILFAGTVMLVIPSVTVLSREYYTFLFFILSRKPVIYTFLDLFASHYYCHFLISTKL